jgi:hypothetical protein
MRQPGYRWRNFNLKSTLVCIGCCRHALTQSSAPESAFGDTQLANAPLGAASNAAAAAAIRQIVLKEVGAMWGKFSEQELSVLEGDDDLVTQIMAKYGFGRGEAYHKVDRVLKGRHV